MAVSELIARLGLDQSQFQSGLDKAKAGVKEFATGLSPLKGALTAAFAAAIIKKMADEVFELAGHLTRLSRQTGINVEELQRLEHASKQSGVEMETLTTGILKMSVAMDKALKGNEETRTAFEGLGISLQDLKTLSPEEVFIKMSDAVKNSNDPVKTAGELNAVFGRNFKELLPLLDRGTDKINELREATPNVISEETISKVRMLKKEFSDLWELISSFGLKTFSKLTSVMYDSLQTMRLLTLQAAKFGLQILPLASLFEKVNGITKEGIEGSIAQLEDEIDHPKTAEKKDLNTERFADQTATEKKSGEEEEKRNERIAELAMSVFKAKEEFARSQLDKEEQITALQEKRAQILDSADSNDSTEERLRNEKEILDIDKDLLTIQKQISDEEAKEADKQIKDFAKTVHERDEQLRHIDELKKGKGVSVSGPIADSLSRIGGFVGNSGNNALRLAEKQIKIQEKIVDYLKEIKGKFDPYGGDSDAITGN